MARLLVIVLQLNTDHEWWKTPLTEIHNSERMKRTTRLTERIQQKPDRVSVGSDFGLKKVFIKSLCSIYSGVCLMYICTEKERERARDTHHQIGVYSS